MKRFKGNSEFANDGCALPEYKRIKKKKARGRKNIDFEKSINKKREQNRSVYKTKEPLLTYEQPIIAMIKHCNNNNNNNNQGYLVLQLPGKSARSELLR